MFKKIILDILKQFPLFPVVVFFGLLAGFGTIIGAAHSEFIKKEDKNKVRDLYIIGFSLIAFFGFIHSYIFYTFG